MMLSTGMILSAVTAAIRVGKVAVDAHEQHVRDKSIDLPRAPRVILTLEQRALTLFNSAPHSDRVGPNGDLQDFWDGVRWKDTPEAIAKILDAAEEILVTQDPNWEDKSTDIDRVVSLKQWGEQSGPIPPIARVGLAILDETLAFAGAHPELMGIGGNGQKYVTALTKNLSVLLPEYETGRPSTIQNWEKFDFADAVARIALRAGLGALQETADVYIKEEHLQALVLGVTRPMISAFEDWPSADQIRLADLRDDLLDPMIAAAVGTVADHQRAFLGQKLDPQRGAGAVTAAILDELKEEGFYRNLGGSGVAALYKAALGVVADRPDLFAGDDSASQRFARDMIGSLAAALRDSDPIWEQSAPELRANLAVEAVRAVSRAVPDMLSETDPWERAAGATAQQVLEGIAEGLGDEAPDLLKSVQIQSVLLTAGRAVLEEASANPAMLVGRRSKDEVKAIVSAVARGMAADKNLLLTKEDWVEIARITTYEASRNVGRLFNIDRSSPEGDLAAHVIERMLKKAAADFPQGGVSADGFLSFGETLRNAMITTLKHASGNAKAALSNLDALEALVSNLNHVVKSDPKAIGADEWQWLFRQFVSTAINTGSVESVSVAAIQAQLQTLRQKQGG